MNKPKSRILVVDDQPMYRMLVSSVIRKSEPDVEIFTETRVRS
jgi:CheY-like chemotaxis protein